VDHYMTYLDVVSSVVVAALSEKTMGDGLVDIDFIQHRISILYNDQIRFYCVIQKRTLLTLAV
jgi:hypothetical protein